MTKDKLIEALKALPGDAEVLMHVVEWDEPVGNVVEVDGVDLYLEHDTPSIAEPPFALIRYGEPPA